MHAMRLHAHQGGAVLMPRRKLPHVEYITARSGSFPIAVEGSKRVLCAKCRKHRVWLTPRIVEEGMRPICLDCARQKGS